VAALLWVLWPLGGLHDGWVQTYPNILASVLCGIALWLWGRRHLRRLHLRHRELLDTHRRILEAVEGRAP
jgi:hypothetical protein